MSRIHLAGLGTLALCLALTCAITSGTEDATLDVRCVPAADVIIDGVHVGESNQTFIVEAGRHRVQVRQEMFREYEAEVTAATDETQTLDVSLVAEEPSHPWVIAKLAASEGIDVAPFVAPSLMRGGGRRRAPAVLLWPARDVRKQGLVNYAIEADETYAGDATLEFRDGRKVLHRETFAPETVTTVRSIPEVVLEHAQVGSKIKWGLYFENARPITTEFRVVRRPKVERQLERLRTSRHMQRQPAITRAILEATVLENNRLYTEALRKNIAVAADHPQSTQPYRGIVTTLRRLDAEGSELFAFVSPHVRGRGGRSGVDTRGSKADGGLGLAAWSPIQEGRAPTPTTLPPTPAAGARGMAPGGSGVTPEGMQEPTPATPAEPGAEEPTRVDDDAMRRDQVDRLQRELADLTAEQQVLDEEHANAQDALTRAEKDAGEAEAAVRAAEQEAAEALAAVQATATPTSEQMQRAYQADKAAQAAREQAKAVRDRLTAAREQANAIEARRTQRSQEIEAMKRSLDLALGGTPTPPGVEPLPYERPAPSGEQLQAALQSAQKDADAARRDWEQAKQLREQAERDYAADPSETNRTRVEAASTLVGRAATYAHECQQALEAARRALESVGDPADAPVVK